MGQHFQYIIIGAGCAGLQLAKALLDLPGKSVKSILLLEADENHREKSWCFWYDKNHVYRDLVEKEWNHIGFSAEGFSTIKNIHPKSYQYINSANFAKYHFDYFKTDHRIKVVFDEVLEITSTNGMNFVKCANQEFKSEYVFYSHPKIMDKQISKPPVWQHFLGWKITTDKDCFDVDKAMLMDFDLGDQPDVRFIYVLPFSKNSAMVECTIFSAEVYDLENYEISLKKYIGKNFTKNYVIELIEQGQIPMSLTKLKSGNVNNVIPIGTAAGCIKASTGYSFVRNMRNTQAIIDQIKKNKKIETRVTTQKYLFYDLLLLRIILHEPLMLKTIFMKLFKNNPINEVLSFLDEKTSLWQDFRIVSSLPQIPFLKAIFRR